jgi:leucyl aminopeptidase
MPQDLLLAASAGSAIALRPVTAAGWAARSGRLPAPVRRWAEAHGFAGQAGRHLVVPGPGGAVGTVLAGVEEAGAAGRDPFALGRLSAVLPAGDYALDLRLVRGKLDRPELLCLSWALSAYRYGRYKAGPAPAARLVVPRGVDADAVRRIVAAVEASRDLINAPANACGPDEIEAAIRALAADQGASVHVTLGDALLTAGFDMIHAVGRASPRAPRLIDMSWGDPTHPKVTLVGKGVAFDTGGLNLKPDAAMLLMKKDMAGAASAIAAARMIMAAKLPVRLRLLVPAVENAVSGAAFRPGDVLRSYKGLSVEIGNTDAEGRLILADALALADEEAPQLMVDFATLTGAARVALGPDLPPFYTHDDRLAADVARLGSAVHDPVWRLPLWPAYDAMLDSRIADVNHVSSGGFAGSITAALFLNRFVRQTGSYLHLDIYGWTPATRPGRPEGGEAQGARLVHALVAERFPRR